jgi:hypothetical protein
LVVLSAPSFAIKVIVALPLALVSGVNVSVNAEFVVPMLLVEVMATVARFVSEELTVTDHIGVRVSVSITVTTACCSWSRLPEWSWT